MVRLFVCVKGRVLFRGVTVAPKARKFLGSILKNVSGEILEEIGTSDRGKFLRDN